MSHPEDTIHHLHPIDPGLMPEKPEKAPSQHSNLSSELVTDIQRGTILGNDVHAGLQRRLGNRQIQLVAIGGSIGTAIFVTIGDALRKSGPGGLLLAFLIYNVMLAMVNNSMAEMSTYMPVSGGFIYLAGKWVDDALGFMVGWNFFLYEAIMIPFEITAINLVLSFWRNDIPPVAVCVACIVIYACLNALAVKGYGEAEFWLSGGKVILIFILFAFTFVTMVGGNPQHDAFGFRHWRHPGPFAEYLRTDDLGRFEGFLAALWAASYTCVGPEYISMVAAEAKYPRIYIKNAFKTAYWRFGVFFVGSALCCGVLVAYNDPTLVAVYSGESEGAGTAAASPYVIAMNNLGVGVLPHIVSALLVTTIFSAGNTYTYCATRSLYGLSVDGKAPKFLSKCTKGGVPIRCVAVVMAFPFLSFLTLSSSSSQVLTWLMNLLTAAAIIDFIVMCVTYIWFYRACKAQGFDRSKLPYKGWLQPWCAIIGCLWMTIVVTCYGYTSFAPWDVTTFFTHYTMLLFDIIAFAGWKLFKRTRILRPDELDLILEAPDITAYEEAAKINNPPIGFWAELIQPFRPRWKNTQGQLDHTA
ncbi:amino acid permease-domain-containing protein [Aspergillus parasiticus]|uniref:Amino acid permease-domain-containing protein n=1 Tax=Aspergillus parasiticus TaxID=5067 RepID=A0A5N6E3T5_ASPPA|nr:amino acid permease-domain-containing protein [Aspergillus parasiticus]